MTQVAATTFGRPLPEGGTIGVCAPSGPYYNRSDVLRPIEWWESKGYRVKLTDGVWAKDDYNAGSPEQRAADLHALFADPEVDVIQVLWGGTGAMSLLPLLDFDLIGANPKALMGYSDITNLHTAIRQETGLATLHGPGLGSMGIAERTAFTWDSALGAFTKGAAGEVPRDPENGWTRSIAGGRASGPLVGGNLFTLAHLIGTPWQPVFDGAILLLEEVDEAAYHIEVELQQLTLAGLLDRVAGVVVGELKDCGKPDAETPRDRSLEDVLERYLGSLDVPVIYPLPLGHGKHLWTVPLGVRATIDGDARTLTIDEPGVR
ncbi:MAG: S66 peptidase family protein [Actinomycetota bacterium]